MPDPIPADHPAVAAALAIYWPHRCAELAAERDRAVKALREILALRVTAGVYRIAYAALRDLGADDA